MSQPDDFSLEQHLKDLRQLVDQMQQGVNDFDQQVKLFQQGQAMVKACRDYLEGAELQVQQLIEGEYQDFPEK